MRLIEQEISSLIYVNLHSSIIEIHAEDIPLGRGGGIKLAVRYITENYVFVINGDTLSEISLKDMKEQTEQYLIISPTISGCIATVPLQDPNGLITYANRYIQDNLLSEFMNTAVNLDWINAGVLYLEKQTILDIFPESGDHEESVLPYLAKQSKLLGYKYKGMGYYLSINTEVELSHANKYLRELES